MIENKILPQVETIVWNGDNTKEVLDFIDDLGYQARWEDEKLSMHRGASPNFRGGKSGRIRILSDKDFEKSSVEYLFKGQFVVKVKELNHIFPCTKLIEKIGERDSITPDISRDTLNRIKKQIDDLEKRVKELEETIELFDK